MQSHCNSPEPNEQTLKDKLLLLREIPIPDGLKQKLFEDIPDTARRNVRRHSHNIRIWQVITAAAVVMFAAFLFVRNSGISPFSARFIAEVNETSQNHSSADQNSITDTNEANSIGQL